MTIGNLIGTIVFWGIIISLNVKGYNFWMERNINGGILLENRIFLLLLVVLDLFAFLYLILWFINTKFGNSICNSILKFLNKKIF